MMQAEIVPEKALEISVEQFDTVSLMLIENPRPIDILRKYQKELIYSDL